MANIGELGFGVKIDDGQLKTATKKVQDEFKKTGDSIEKNLVTKTNKGVSSIGSSLGGLGGMLAGIFSVTAIVGFTKKLFGLGSDMEEISSKFDVVFKGSQKVRQEFEDMANATNRSNLDMIQFGSSIGNVLAPLGLAQTEVDAMSLSLTKLAVDVASFNNVSDDQAVHAFTTALSGEREALKSLGIVISEEDVQNKAYNLGFIKQGEALTKAQKALVTYQLLIDNTSNAHGDAIRTGASFANQLKGLQGAIKDTFANAGRDTANETAGMLKNLTLFVSSYGGAIIKSIIEASKMIGSVIGDLISTFGDLFGYIGEGTTQTEDNLNGFALVFMKIVQGFGVGVKFIGTVFKTLVDLIAILLGNIVSQFMISYSVITNGWDIVKTAFIGTIKTIIGAMSLGADTIGQIFVGMAEAVVGVFKGIADNVAVAVKKAVNLAVKGINGFVDIANKIPGVNMNKLVGFDDVNFKPFDLKISKNINTIKGKFEKFGSDVKDNYSGISDSFKAIGDGFVTATAYADNVTNQSMLNIGNNRGELATDITTSNDKITRSIEDGAKKSQENAKLYDQGYFSILGLIDKYKAGVDDSTKKTAKQGEVAKQAIDKIKDQYKEWEKKIDDVNKAQEKLKDDTKQYNQEIEDSVRSLNKELAKTTEEYEKTAKQIKKETRKDIATRGAEIDKEILDINKEISDLKISSTTDEADRQNKLLELEKEKTALIKEQEFVKANTSEKDRAEATKYAGLSDAEKIKADAETELAEKKKVFDEEKQRLTSLANINKAFQNIKYMDQKTYDALIASETFANMTAEEQELTLKLARDKLQLSQQKDAIIGMQEDIFYATVELSNSATAIQQANIATLKSEYATLISQIQTAINKQRELNATKSKGFAVGGFTGTGGTNEVAGVVHKGEWVAPKWMVNSMKPLFDSLESARGKGFASGGYTNNTNKTQNNNITVKNGMDLRGFLDYAKWKM